MGPVSIITLPIVNSIAQLEGKSMSNEKYL